MFKNYLKIAWRNLIKNSFYSLINCLGLTVGLAVGILILLWVQDELSFDRFNKQAGNIYKLENRVGTGTSEQIWSSTVAPIANFAKAELPEVQDAAVGLIMVLTLYLNTGIKFLMKKILLLRILLCLKYLILS